jgi:hypothetical protein
MARRLQTPSALACILPLVAFLITCLVIQLQPANIWSTNDGPMSDRYCEPRWPDSAVLEPTNSWSNVVYVIVGAWALGCSVSDALALRARSTELPTEIPTAKATDVGELRAHPLISLLFGLSWCTLGLGSFLFHATYRKPMAWMDVAMTVAAPISMACWSASSIALFHIPPLRNRPTMVVWATAALILMIDTIYAVRVEGRDVTTWVATAVAFLAFTEGCVQPALAVRSWVYRASVWCAAGFMLFAYLIREAEVSAAWNYPLCMYSVWFQPHAVWHVFSGIAMGLMLHAWRMKPPPMPDCRRQWRCCCIRQSRPPPVAHGGHALAPGGLPADRLG